MKKLSQIIIASTAAAFGGLALASCEKEHLLTDNYPEAYPTTEIEFVVSDVLPLGVGMDSTLVVNVGPELATDKTVLFKSNNTSVATVDPNGKITAVAVGEATISAVPVIGFGANASVLVKVIPQVIKAQQVNVTNVTEPSEEGFFYETDEVQLACEILPADHTYDYVTWTSSTPDVATVDSKGLVKCIKEGDAVIRCHTHDHSNVAGEFRFHVYKMQEVESIDIKPLAGPLCITQGNVKLDVNYLPYGATVGTVVWESSDETIVSVRRGVITPKGWGTATVTAKAPSGNTASVTVTVEKGWYVWDGKWGFGNWQAGNMSIVDGIFHADFPNAGSGKWRNDLKYTGLVTPTVLLPMDWASHPVLAVLIKNLKAGGNNSLDAVDNLSGINSGNLKAVRTDLNDDWALLVWNAGAKYNNAYAEMRIFNLKIADIPNDRYTWSDAAKPYYEIKWIRTFTSADEALKLATEDVNAM